jgi:hypothetical protein
VIVVEALVHVDTWAHGVGDVGLVSRRAGLDTFVRSFRVCATLVVVAQAQIVQLSVQTFVQICKDVVVTTAQKG